MTRATMLTAVCDIKYKHSPHWAEALFQGNAEKGPLVGSLQPSLKLLWSWSLLAKMEET